MKKVYGKYPDHAKHEVEKQVRSLSRRLGVEPPTVQGWYSGNAQYDPDNKTLRLPNKAFADEYDPEFRQDHDRYWGLVLHEFAHYLEHLWYGDTNHTPVMYSILFGLALMEGIPLDALEEYESNYKPRSFKTGRKVAGRTILSAHKGVLR